MSAITHRMVTALLAVAACALTFTACTAEVGPGRPFALSMGAAPAVASADIVIPVWIHSIVDDHHAGLPEAHAEALIEYVNDAYAAQLNSVSTRTPFRFNLVQQRDVTHPEWFDPELPFARQLAFRRSLHVGDARTLNIIVPSHQQAGGVSFSSFPDQVADSLDQDAVSLGESVLHTTVEAFGPTLVHELGHWLGLLHTFATCDADDQGDLVADTPAHVRTEPDGHDHDADTCPKLPGRDPTHNFMTYYGTGPYEFTPGQVQRMTREWARYRA